MKIFLDDERDPQMCLGYMYLRIGARNPIYKQGGWLIVRTPSEFKAAIERHHNEITHVSFDHDLADGHYHESMDKSLADYEQHLKGVKEETGYECAKWMKEFYDKSLLNYPEVYIHSMNPVGCDRIKSVFES